MNWPDLTTLSGNLEQIDATLGKWWLAAAMVALFAEAFPILGLLAPGLTLLVFAGFKSADSSLPEAMMAFAACLVAIVIADCLAFLLGRASEQRFPKLGARLRGLAGESRDWGGATTGTLLFYQFPPYARMFAPIMLGHFGYPARRWAILVLSASSLFILVAFGSGYLAGAVGQGIADAATGVNNIIALLSLAFLISVGAIMLRLRSRKKDRP